MTGFRNLLSCIALLLVTNCVVRAEIETTTWLNPIKKQGYLDSPVVEATPFIFRDRLYLLENWQAFFDVAGAKPGQYFHDDVARIRDVETNKIISTAMKNCGFATAFVWQGRVYVFAGNYGHGKKWRRIREILMTSSDDLVRWSEPVSVLRAEGNELLFNTAVCRGKDGFVLLYETDDKRWPAFTFKHCTSGDLVHWKRIDDAVYGRDKYVGGPALYYEGGWYYTLYLQSLGHGWETRITRSRDLVNWQDAPPGRPFVTFDPSRKNLPLRPKDANEINASDAELCEFRGQTIIYFTGADQQVAGDLQWATFEGTARELFERFFDDQHVENTNSP